ncbi:hypothetical protein E2542_SST10003 [Spatholobus suberectus]|nr:hypothetical protein E2542_SST10003 [Spatholobus suberectus]
MVRFIGEHVLHSVILTKFLRSGENSGDEPNIAENLASRVSSFRPEDGTTLKPICLLQLCHIGVILHDWFDN